MDTNTLQATVAKYPPQQLQAIEEYCIKLQGKRHLSMYSLGAAVAVKFGVTKIEGIKLANAFNRYMLTNRIG